MQQMTAFTRQLMHNTEWKVLPQTSNYSAVRQGLMAESGGLCMYIAYKHTVTTAGSSLMLKQSAHHQKLLHSLTYLCDGVDG